MSEYKGKPFQDAGYPGGPQAIPGRVLCAYYDFGGEGVAYHDTDSVNHGSGALNPANGTYLNEFRMEEGVDTSYVKGGGVDDHPYNFVEPELGQLYVGWTEPGEWVKYTVDVKQTGLYKVSLFFTSNRGGKISISVNDKDATGPISIKSTFRAEDPLPWRQWHHWDRMDGIANIHLDMGIQVLTLHTLAEGNLNYAHLDFQFLGKR
jgi:hypothetical protein